MPPPADVIGQPLPRFQHRAENPRIGPYLERVGLAKTTRQQLPRAGAVIARKRLHVPAWRTAPRARLDPDLEQRRRVVLAIIFGMLDAGACAHHLDIARAGPSLVAQRILVGNRAAAHISDDFHVAVAMWRKARLCGDDIVVPHADAPPSHPRRVIIVRKRKMMVGVQPAMIGRAERSKRSNVGHVRIPHRRGVAAGRPSNWDAAGWRQGGCPTYNQIGYRAPFKGVEHAKPCPRCP